VKHFLFLMFLLVPALASAVPRDDSDAATRARWVFFRDHGPEPRDPALAEAPHTLSPRALARRARAARERGDPPQGGAAARDELDLDLDPSAAYIAAVERAGALTRTRSRWLNAISVDASPAALARIRALPFVKEIEPVATVSRDGVDGIAAADGTHYGPSLHQVEMLGVPEAHALGHRGQGVLICVLDSGFDLSHDALRHVVVREERDFLRHDRDVSFDAAQDLPRQAFHGTLVLSVLAGHAPGELVGPAPEAEFLLGKTEDIGREVPVEEDAWIAAVEWAEERGADILVSSLTYVAWYRPQDRDGRIAIITRAANVAFERGLLIVNSIGNYGPKERTLSPPSDAPGVIAVGSVDWNGEISAFSSLGPTWDGRVKPDLVAMGSGTRVVAPGTRDGYASGSGTSFSNPLVAGCAAIVLSAHPDWGPEAVREALTMSADRASRPDPRYGWGVPNARDAVHYPAIEGIVRDAHTREPIANASVRWEPDAHIDSASVAPTDSPPRGATATDAAGAYLIPNLPRGRYVLRIDAPGYFETTTEPLEVPPGLGDVDFTLRYRGE
jgi:serine protease AprX